MNKKTNNLLLLLLGVLCLVAVIWFLTNFLIADNQQNDPKKPEQRASTSTVTSLQDTNWAIREVNSQTDADLIIIANQDLSLEFTANKIYAHICNNISGDYEIKNNLLVTPGLVSTRMFCEGDLMTIENTFLNLIENNQLLEINDRGELIIGNNEGEKIIFTEITSNKDVSLANSHWILSHHRVNGAWQDDSAYQITLNFDSEFFGGQACNSFGGDYQVEGGEIFAANIALTQMLCGDEELMTVEQILTQALNGRTTYEFDYDGNLIIKKGEEQQFKFYPASSTNPLADTTWLLESKGNGAVWTDLSKTGATINFSNDYVGGQACNRFGGDYRLEDNQIIMTGNLISTLMYCHEEDLMTAESTISEVLGSNPEYILKNDTLTLISAEGLQLKFNRSELE